MFFSKMMSKSGGLKTPIRKSARINQESISLDSTPVLRTKIRYAKNASSPSTVKPKSLAKVKDKSPRKSESKKGKQKKKILVEPQQPSMPHDSDFEDEVPILKRPRLIKEVGTSGVKAKSIDVNKPAKDKLSGQIKREGKKVEKVQKPKAPLSRWLCYTNFDIFDEIMDRLSKVNLLHLFKDGLFGYMLDLPRLKCQAQLIRALVHNEVRGDRNDSFTFRLNGKVLNFGLYEFKVVTGFKCGSLDDFVHDLDGPSKLMDTYFPNFKDMSVPKKEFIRDFHEEGLAKDEHIFDMCVLYLISTFILSSPPSKSVVPKDHFLLVESGKYSTYPWGYLSFFEFRDSISTQMAEDPDYVRLFGFPIALQIWFYESCNQVDRNIAVRLRTRTPRMLNWSIDERKIFYEHLKKGMFRDIGNPYKFRNLDFTTDELDAIRLEELGGTKTRSVGRVPLVSGSETRPGQSHGSGDADNREEFATGKSHQSVEKLETEIMLVRKQLSDLKAKVDGQFAEMKLFIVDSLKNFLNEINIQRKPESRSDNALSPKNISNEQGRPLNEAPGSSVFDDVVADKVVEEICKFYSVDCTQSESSKDTSQGLPGERLNAECTDDPMSLIAGDFTGAAHKTPTLDDFDFPDMRESQIVAIENRLPYITPAQQPRTRAPGKYAQSPYTELMDSIGTSGTGTGTVLFQMKHPFVESLSFDGDQKLMESFQAWFKKRLSKKRGRKLSAFTVAENKISPPFDFGVDRVEVMDWFYDLITTGRPWTDLHVDVIMYYLRKKSKYGLGNETRVTFTDSFFIRWVEQIFDSWTKNLKNSQLITPDHEVAQYIRGFKIHANTPWELVDLVCIPINLPEACHWVLAILSIKSRCLHVFDSLCDMGAKHFAAVNAVAKKLAAIIPLFFISTGFYGKRNDIDWNNAPEYIDCTAADPLGYFIADNSPQQSADSNDCDLYTCALAEYISQGQLHIDNARTLIFPELFRLRYEALLWDYAVRKIDAGAVSESEVTGKVTSRRGGPLNSREYIPVSDKVAPSKYVPRRK